MLPEKQCIEFWTNHLDKNEGSLTDHQYAIITSTVSHLKELVKLKENPTLPIAPLVCKFVGQKHG